MAVNPCCMPLRKGVFIMVVIDTILSIIGLTVASWDLQRLTEDNDDKNSTTIYLTSTSDWYRNKSKGNIGIAIVGVCMIIAIIGVLLSLRLYFGVKKRDIPKCRKWIYIKLTLFCLNLLSLIVNSSAGRETKPSFAVTIITLFYHIYMMYCVHCLIQEMKMDASRPGFQARLENGLAYVTDNYPYPTNPNQVPQRPQSKQPTIATISGNNNNNPTPENYPTNPQMYQQQQPQPQQSTVFTFFDSNNHTPNCPPPSYSENPEPQSNQEPPFRRKLISIRFNSIDISMTEDSTA